MTWEDLVRDISRGRTILFTQGMFYPGNEHIVLSLQQNLTFKDNHVLKIKFYVPTGTYCVGLGLM